MIKKILLFFAVNACLFFLLKKTTLFDFVEIGFERFKYFFADYTVRKADTDYKSFVRFPDDHPAADEIVMIDFSRQDQENPAPYAHWRNRIAGETVSILADGPKAILLDFHIEDRSEMFATDAMKLSGIFKKSGRVILDYLFGTPRDLGFNDLINAFLETSKISAVRFMHGPRRFF